MFRENSSFIETILYDSPGCKILKNGSEGAVYHLANVMFTLGYMSGSGFFGLVYLFSLLGVGFFIQSLWGWVDACGVDIFMWSLLLFVFCLVQLAHIGYRLRKVNFDEDFTNLYKAMFRPLEVPLNVYKEIVNCCDAEVTSLAREQNYAVEGKTAIDRLSLLLSGRKDGSLRGVTVPGSRELQVKASLYMDGIAIFCLDPVLSAQTHEFKLALEAKKFRKKNTFDHKSIRKWSARSILETMREKERWILLDGSLGRQSTLFGRMPHHQNFPTSTKTLLD
eukprot:g42137.t1